VVVRLAQAEFSKTKNNSLGLRVGRAVYPKFLLTQYSFDVSPPFSNDSILGGGGGPPPKGIGQIGGNWPIPVLD